MPGTAHELLLVAGSRHRFSPEPAAQSRHDLLLWLRRGSQQLDVPSGGDC